MAWPIALLKLAPHAVSIYKEGMGLLRERQSELVAQQKEAAAAQALAEMKTRLASLETVIAAQGDAIEGLAEATVRDVRTLARTVFIGLGFAAVWLIVLTALVLTG